MKSSSFGVSSSSGVAGVSFSGVAGEPTDSDEVRLIDETLARYSEERKKKVKSIMTYLKISSRVMKDKCWHTLWNFDLFSPVSRIYPSENYYGSFINLLTDDAAKIVDNIYLGSAFNAADYDWLKENEIFGIINVTTCISNYYADEFQYFNYGATDLNNSSLTGFYEISYNILTNNPEKKFLVHCFAGKSRSASIVLYYLMREYSWPLERALKHIKNCRPCININTTFIAEILSLFPEREEDRRGVGDEDADGGEDDVVTGVVGNLKTGVVVNLEDTGVSLEDIDHHSPLEIVYTYDSTNFLP